ncbi:MAG: twin-arginine translocase TatA/TatE family subunit, partial [Cytophagales bacterium]|nr:twin-arginine translocase TatA/TatE family subunit [Cytophagales bacterium]
MQTILLWVPGWGEMLTIAFFTLILFGAKTIPETARATGTGIREFNHPTQLLKKAI